MKAFFGKSNFLFVKMLGPENASYSVDPPNLEKEGKGKKFLIIVKTNANRTPEAPFPEGIQKDVVFMELNKPVLDNLYAVCQVSLNFITLLTLIRIFVLEELLNYSNRCSD